MTIMLWFMTWVIRCSRRFFFCFLSVFYFGGDCRFLFWDLGCMRFVTPGLIAGPSAQLSKLEPVENYSLVCGFGWLIETSLRDPENSRWKDSRANTDFHELELKSRKTDTSHSSGDDLGIDSRKFASDRGWNFITVLLPGATVPPTFFSCSFGFWLVFLVLIESSPRPINPVIAHENSTFIWPS